MASLEIGTTATTVTSVVGSMPCKLSPAFMSSILIRLLFLPLHHGDETPRHNLHLLTRGGVCGVVAYDTLILAIIELLHLIRMLLVYLSALGELIGRAARRLSLDSSFPFRV